MKQLGGGMQIHRPAREGKLFFGSVQSRLIGGRARKPAQRWPQIPGIEVIQPRLPVSLLPRKDHPRPFLAINGYPPPRCPASPTILRHQIPKRIAHKDRGCTVHNRLHQAALAILEIARVILGCAGCRCQSILRFMAQCMRCIVGLIARLIKCGKRGGQPVP
jgi:hypothetical protein